MARRSESLTKETHQLRGGDCIAGLEQLGRRSVDHIITDPPYRPAINEGARSLRAHGGIHSRDFGYGGMTPELRFAASYHFARVARRWVLVFCDIESADDWRRDLTHAGLTFIRTGAWFRTNGAPQFTGDRPSVPFEAVVIMHAKRKRLRWNGGGSPASWSLPVVNGNDSVRIHTTQKPLALMETLVRQFTDPGELVLDAFAGGGTTGVACKRLGRRFLGWEKNVHFSRKARARIRAAREQIELPPAPLVRPKQASMVALLAEAGRVKRAIKNSA